MPTANSKPRKRPQRQDSESASSPSETQTNIINHIRAGYPGLYLVSAEEARVEAEIRSVATTLEYQLFHWSVVTGLVNATTGSTHNGNDPLEAMQAIEELPEKSVILLREFHLFLQEPNPFLIRKVKDVLQLAKTSNKTLIVLGCRLCLPPELERELTIIDFALPGKDQLKEVLKGICQSAEQEIPENDDKILDAATGLTTIEAENAFALSVVEAGTITPAVVAREKAQAVKKNGLLEIVKTNEGLDEVGGLDLLKEWLLKRKNAFSQQAIEYGLPTPKGLLIVGIAGTGKSLTAKATAQVFGVPLLKLDAGKLYGGIVGQSESNLRTVIQTAEAIAPCCLWLDELEKGFSGSKSSGSTDGGTSARVFGSFLNWMQEKTKPVFIVATANDVSQLPPELLRKGRFDDSFFVDLPQLAEREHIWRIQIAKYGRDAEDYDITQLAKITEGFTGAEIEQLYVESLYNTFDRNTEPTDLDIAGVHGDFVPLSKLMAEQIKALRQWSQGRTRSATTPEVSTGRIRKLAA